ncbi:MULTISPECIES: hypothetical protein [unclassified Mesorhizobium]|uniref:hypothetical protein n=1 Tax=unclassified Mesorhizobium TaxID=325217 RepID=UPI00333AD1B9
MLVAIDAAGHFSAANDLSEKFATEPADAALIEADEAQRPPTVAGRGLLLQNSCGRSSHGLPFGDGLQAMNMYGESRTFGAGRDEEVAEG